MEHRTASFLGAALAAGFTLVHLALEAAAGGVVSHHPLADPDLPAISNFYGLLTLPVLGALTGRRYAVVGLGAVLRGLLPALLYGALLAGAFELGDEALATRLFQGLFLLALCLPVHRIECLTGFALGMAVTFGGVLPVAIGGVVALLSLAISASIGRLLALFRRRAAGAGTD